MGSLKLVTAPTLRPVEVEDLKAYARIDDCEEPAKLELLLDAAINLLEEHTGLKFMTQTWDYFLDSFPCGGEEWWDGVRDGHIAQLTSLKGDIKIPLAVIQSVTFFKTIDNDNAESTFSSSSYYVDTVRKEGRIALRLGETWPATVLRTANGIQIRCVVGYASAALVPAPIKQAILETATGIYQGGEGIPKLALQLVEKYRVIHA